MIRSTLFKKLDNQDIVFPGQYFCIPMNPNNLYEVQEGWLSELYYEEHDGNLFFMYDSVTGDPSQRLVNGCNHTFFGPIGKPGNLPQQAMAKQALKRPDNFDSLDMDEQWAIDKELGILDWEGPNESLPPLMTIDGNGSVNSIR